MSVSSFFDHSVLSVLLNYSSCDLSTGAWRQHKLNEITRKVVRKGAFSFCLQSLFWGSRLLCIAVKHVLPSLETVMKLKQLFKKKSKPSISYSQSLIYFVCLDVIYYTITLPIRKGTQCIIEQVGCETDVSHMGTALWSSSGKIQVCVLDTSCYNQKNCF